MIGPGCVCGGAWGPGRGWPVTALSRAHWARPSRAEPSFVFVCVITLLLPDHPTGSASAADPLSLCCRRPWALSSVAARMVRSPRSPSLRRRRARSSLSPNLARGGRWTTCAFLSPARPGTNPATPGLCPPWPGLHPMISCRTPSLWTEILERLWSPKVPQGLRGLFPNLRLVPFLASP